MSKARRVTTLRQLMALSTRGKAVTCPNWPKHCPAAFVVSMQARVVWQFIQRGLFEYRREA